MTDSGATSQPPIGAVADLRACKADARRLLPVGHPVRIVLEAEPDFLMGPDAADRFVALMRMILAHRRQPKVG